MPDVFREDVVERGRFAHLPGTVHDDAGEGVAQPDNRSFYGTPYVHACLRDFSDENGSRLPFSSHFSSIGATGDFVKSACRLPRSQKNRENVRILLTKKLEKVQVLPVKKLEKVRISVYNYREKVTA